MYVHAYVCMCIHILSTLFKSILFLKYSNKMHTTVIPSNKSSTVLYIVLCYIVVIGTCVCIDKPDFIYVTLFIFCRITSARSPIKVQQHKEKESKAWQEMCATISHEWVCFSPWQPWIMWSPPHRFSNRRGINIGEVSVLVEAKKLVGTRCVSIKSGPKGVLHLEKQWSSSSSFHAYQTIVMVMKFA